MYFLFCLVHILKVAHKNMETKLIQNVWKCWVEAALLMILGWKRIQMNGSSLKTSKKKTHCDTLSAAIHCVNWKCQMTGKYFINDSENPLWDFNDYILHKE